MDETRAEGAAAQSLTEDALTEDALTEDAAVMATEQSTGSIDVTGSSPEIVSDHTTDDLKIVMGEFDGPLDL